MKYFNVFESFQNKEKMDQYMLSIAKTGIRDSRKDVIDMLVRKGFDLENYKQELVKYCISEVYDFISLQWFLDEGEYKKTINTIGSLYLNNKDLDTLQGLQPLHNLKSLNINNNNISDLSPIAGLTSLTSIRMNNNNISDLSPIAGLISLTYLDVERNDIKDLSIVKKLPNLETVEVGKNPLPKELQGYGVSVERLRHYYSNDEELMGVDTKVKLKYFTGGRMRELISDEELYALDIQFKLSHTNISEYHINLHNYFSEQDFLKLKTEVETKDKLYYFKNSANSDFFTNNINKLISEQELYDLDMRYKLKNPLPNTTLNEDMHHYFNDSDKRELLKVDPIEKVELFSPYMINTEKLLSEEEIFSIDKMYKLENRYKKIATNNDRMSNIDLFDYITEEEAKEIPVDERIDNLFKVTKEEESLLKPYQKFTYTYRKLSIDDDDYIEFLNSVLKVQNFKGKIETIAKTDLDYEDLFEEEIIESEEYPGQVKGYGGIIELEISEDDYWEDIVGVSYEDYIIRNIDHYDNNYLMDVESEKEYVASYMDEETIKLVQELMDILGFEYIIDDEETGEKKKNIIYSEGVIQEFFETNESVLYITTNHGKSNVELVDFLYDVDSENTNLLSYNINTIKGYFPYDYVTVRHSNFVEFKLDELFPYLEEEEIENVDDLISKTPGFYDFIEVYNKEITLLNKNLKKGEEKKEILHSQDFEEHGISADHTTSNKTFRKVLEEVRERLEYDSEDESMIDKIKKINKTVKDLGFKNKEYRKNGITIRIKEYDLEGSRVKISRIGNDKSEEGWVRVENLYTYLQKNLFENKIKTKTNSNTTRFKKFDDF